MEYNLYRLFARQLLFTLLIISSVVCRQRKAVQNSCTYSVQVWNPNEDVLRKIESLETRQSLIELKLAAEVAQLKVDIHLKHNVTELLSTFSDLQRQEIELRVALEGMQLLVNKTVASSQAQLQQLNRHQFHHSVDETSQQLKTAVNDLKAEWLMIKRDIQLVKADAIGLASDIKTADTVLRENLVHFEHNTTKLHEQVDKLSSKVDHLNNKYQQVLGRLDNEFAGQFETLKLNIDKLYKAQQLTPIEHGLATNNPSEIATNKLQSSVFETLPRDCQGVYDSGQHVSAMYEVSPEGAEGQKEQVYCEMDTATGTGWTVIQRRESGSVSFNRRWLEYQFGFGSLYGEFWLGNQLIHRLTSRENCRLRIDLWDWEGSRGTAHYGEFRVDNERQKYRLHVRHFSGDVGDSFSTHDGLAFSTDDTDNDLYQGNCAQETKGGWWFDSCFSTHLNGLYHTGRYPKKKDSFSDGIVWYTWKQTEYYSLRKTEMKITTKQMTN